MQVIFIRRKIIINVIMVLFIIGVFTAYVRGAGREYIAVFTNNESLMPICSVDVPDKRIALTIDTGWGDQYTEDILSTLKRYNVKATFFVTGAWVDRYPDMLKRIHEYRHDIGNHSTTHVKMVGLSKSTILNEIMQTEVKIYDITNKTTKLFRPPFGAYDNRLVDVAKGKGYSVIKWDVDSQDWQDIGEEEIHKKVLENVSNGSIILFHSNGTNTSNALELVIENLRKDGYAFTTLSELLMKEDFYIDNTGRQKLLR